MLFIPGFIIGWLTFPGIIVHEFAHKNVCDRRGIRVTDVTWVSIGGSGEVVHEKPRNYWDTIWINLAPFVLNTSLAFCLYTIAILILSNAGGSMEGMPLLGLGVIVWLALSIGWHAIPSSTDAGNILDAVFGNWRSSPILVLLLPVVLVLYVANLLKFFWFDAIYSLLLGALALVVLDASPIGIAF